MAHFRNKDSHSGALITVIETEFHLIALGIEGGNVFVKLVARDEKSFKFPFDAHKDKVGRKENKGGFYFFVV